MQKILTLMTLFLSLNALAQEKVFHIYQDADLSRHKESSKAIQQGIEIAFSEINNEIQGYKFVFKYLDHRGNVIRSKRNYQTFIDDPNALVIYSGIHSPPLIKNRTFINENKALTLVPWAAGGPITRYPSTKNWIFRLSVDDTQAASTIINFAVNNKQCKNPHLLLENTSWGSSNLKSMSNELMKHGINKPLVTRFDWNLKNKGARFILRKIVNTDSDCIILVSNTIEGSVIVNEMNALDLHLPIISHWGITGGDFHERVNHQQRNKLDLHFIQTCFAFTNADQSIFAKNVFSRLKSSSKGNISKVEDLKSAVGFIHAYDLTKLFIQAIQQTSLTGDVIKDRDAIRIALENINTPIQGLIKNYIKPFSVFDKNTNNNAHEALSNEHYCLGSYGKYDEVLIQPIKQ